MKFSILVVLALSVLVSFGGCANKQYKRVFVYGFGTMNVPRDASVEKIDDLVAQQYGANLFWSPR